MGKKKLSVEEILAAARQADAGESSGAAEARSSDPPADVESPVEAEAVDASAEESPAPKPTAQGARPSVAEMMAMARAEKKGGGKPAAKPKPAAEKPKAETPKPAAKKEKPAPAAAGAPASTASILEAARAELRRGPKSKAEAGIVPDDEVTFSEPEPVKAKPKPKEKPTVPPMPAKPDYAKKPKAKAATEDRRGFVTIFGLMVGTGLGVGFTSLAATLTMWTLGLARFMFPNILTEPPSRFKIGFPAEFPPDQVSTKFKAQFGIWVANAEYNGVRQVYALSTVCTHLGCTPNWLEAEQKFKCPCHGSGFYKDGINFEGPAPRPLERYAIRIAEDGQLEVDKSRKFQEEKGEWASTDCFVTV